MPNNKRRRFGAKKIPNHNVMTTTTSVCSSTNVQRLHHQHGRWNLRCTKSRQNRVSCSCVKAPQRKRSLQSPDHSSLQTSKTQDETSHSDDVKLFRDRLESATRARASTSYCTVHSYSFQTVELPQQDPRFSTPNCMKILNTMDLPWEKYSKVIVALENTYYRQVFICILPEIREYWVDSLV